MERYVLLEQYFCGKKYSTNKYVYSIETPFKIGDLVKGSNYIGKIVKEVNKPNFVCKRTSLTDIENARQLLKQLYSDMAYDYWGKIEGSTIYDPSMGYVYIDPACLNWDDIHKIIEKDSIKYSNEILTLLLNGGVMNNGNTI